ncbi:MAG: hypothetical protein INQ03_21400 [Candidatus Heimdallarchaeota archaeon]|nr:hypothetical protein [Candidatus Heimdallarchaeota archaeon]
MSKKFKDYIAFDHIFFSLSEMDFEKLVEILAPFPPSRKLGQKVAVWLGDGSYLEVMNSEWKDGIGIILSSIDPNSFDINTLITSNPNFDWIVEDQQLQNGDPWYKIMYSSLEENSLKLFLMKYFAYDIASMHEMNFTDDDRNPDNTPFADSLQEICIKLSENSLSQFENDHQWMPWDLKKDDKFIYVEINQRNNNQMKINFDLSDVTYPSLAKITLRANREILDSIQSINWDKMAVIGDSIVIDFE